MMDPATFSSRETWLAYLIGYQDGRKDYEELVNAKDRTGVISPGTIEE